MQDNKGFSAMELLTVIGIIAIMAAIAVPSLISWRNNSQLSRATQDVYSHLQRAKAEAARRNQLITVTFSNNECVVYIDDGSWTWEDGEEIIGPLNWSEYPGVSLDTTQGGGDGLIFTNPNDSISFAPNGFCLDNTGSLIGGTVFLSNNNRQTQITITATGSVSIN